MLTPEARKANTVARKARNVADNLARRDKNRDAVLTLGLQPRESMHTKTSTSKDGKSRTFTVTKNVRASKLLRDDRRAVAKLLAAKTAAAIRTASEQKAEAVGEAAATAAQAVASIGPVE